MVDHHVVKLVGRLVQKGESKTGRDQPNDSSQRKESLQVEPGGSSSPVSPHRTVVRSVEPVEEKELQMSGNVTARKADVAQKEEQMQSCPQCGRDALAWADELGVCVECAKEGPMQSEVAEQKQIDEINKEVQMLDRQRFIEDGEYIEIKGQMVRIFGTTRESAKVSEEARKAVETPRKEKIDAKKIVKKGQMLNDVENRASLEEINREMTMLDHRGFIEEGELKRRAEEVQKRRESNLKGLRSGKVISREIYGEKMPEEWKKTIAEDRKRKEKGYVKLDDARLKELVARVEAEKEKERLGMTEILKMVDEELEKEFDDPKGGPDTSVSDVHMWILRMFELWGSEMKIPGRYVFKRLQSTEVLRQMERKDRERLVELLKEAVFTKSWSRRMAKDGKLKAVKKMNARLLKAQKELWAVATEAATVAPVREKSLVTKSEREAAIQDLVTREVAKQLEMIAGPKAMKSVRAKLLKAKVGPMAMREVLRRTTIDREEISVDEVAEIVMEFVRFCGKSMTDEARKKFMDFVSVDHLEKVSQTERATVVRYVMKLMSGRSKNNLQTKKDLWELVTKSLKVREGEKGTSLLTAQKKTKITA